MPLTYAQEKTLEHGQLPKAAPEERAILDAIVRAALDWYNVVERGGIDVRTNGDDVRTRLVAACAKADR